MKERSAELSALEIPNTSTVVQHPLLEKIGAYSTNLVGAAILINGGGTLASSISHNSLVLFAFGFGIATGGAILISVADEWKQRIWKAETTSEQE